MTFIQKHQEVYGNTIEMNQPYALLTILFIFFLIMLIAFPSNLINKTGQTGNDGTKDAEIIVPLKYLSNF